MADDQGDGYLQVGDSAKQPKPSRWAEFRKYANDTDKGTRCGKKPEHWQQLILFYFCYYAGVTLLFALCFGVMLSTLPDKKDGPRLSSLISSSLVSFPQDIDYTSGDASTYEKEVKQIIRGLKRSGYKTGNHTIGACTFDLGDENESFGFAANMPMVFVRFNRQSGKNPDGTVLTIEQEGGSIATNPAGTVTVADGDGKFEGQNEYTDPLGCVQFGDLTAQASGKTFRTRFFKEGGGGKTGVDVKIVIP